MNTPNIKEIDRVLQFILATAGREDDFKDRELGPIHLIKYLYLADLAYAEEHQGATYTGVTWRFHYFGPWSNEAYTRIEPALEEIGAICKKLPSKYEKDMVRWTIRDDDLYRRLLEELPPELIRPVKKYVHQFNGMTEDLLHFVYVTRPMLKGRPGAVLDFSVPRRLIPDKDRCADSPGATGEGLSFKQKKKKKEAIEALRKHIQDRMEVKMKRPRIKPHSPRFDEVYYEGLKTLESLAGEAIPATRGTVYFSDDIWESSARFDPDVS